MDSTNVVKNVIEKLVTAGLKKYKSEELDRLKQSTKKDEIWDLLKKTMEIKNPSRLRETALDGVNRLLLSNFFENDNEFLGEIMVSAIQSFAPMSSQTSEENIHVTVLKLILTLTTHSNMNGSGLLKAVQTCFNMHMYSKNKSVCSVSRGSLLQLLGHKISSNEDLSLVLKAICRISTKQLEQQTMIKCRTLCLETLLIMINEVEVGENAGEICSCICFNTGLCLEATVELFLKVMKRFKEFRNEIPSMFESFYPHLNSMVMNAFNEISKHQQLLIELYANYDCEMGMPHLIEELVTQVLGSNGLFVVETMLQTLVLMDQVESISPEAQEVVQKKEFAKNGIQQFNMNWKKGIEFLEAFDILKTAESKAYFFMTHSVDVDQLGSYLMDHGNREIMECFIQLLDFTNMDFVDALRRLMNTVRIRGEGQAIDRVMYLFAKKYMEGNPDTFVSVDSAHTFAFSVIMLNTDLHSANIKTKITLEEFMKNFHATESPDAFACSQLEKVYFDLKENELIFTPTKKLLIKEWKKVQLTDFARLFYSLLHKKVIFHLTSNCRIQSLKNCVLICCRFQLPQLIDCIESLSSIRNQESFSALCFCANNYGECFRESWFPFLNFVFQFDLNDNETVLLVDSVFTLSCKLSILALCDFITGLCRVTEVNKSASGLKRITEVCYYNLTRLNSESQMFFDPVFELFIKLSLVKDVQLFAVDSMRQLTIKIFQKNICLQSTLFNVFKKMLDSDVKDAVMSSILNIVQIHADIIQEGWKSIFEICLLNPQHESLDLILSQNLNSIEYTNCLAQVCISTKSSKLVSRLCELESASSLLDVVIRNESPNLRIIAATKFFSLVHNQELNKLIIKLFSDSQVDLVWVNCLQQLYQIWTPDDSEILKILCHVIQETLNQKNESIALCAIACLQDILSFSVKFNTLSWDLISLSIPQFISSTCPSEFASICLSDDSKQLGLIVTKSSIHLALLESLKPTSESEFCYPLNFYDQILPSLRKSRDMASLFNENKDLRFSIFKAKLTAFPPHLLQQESVAQSLVILLSCRKLMHYPTQSHRPLLELCLSLIDDYSKLPEEQKSSAEMVIKVKETVSPLCSLMFQNLILLCSKCPSVSVFKPLFKKTIEFASQTDVNLTPFALDFLLCVANKVIDPIWPD